MIKEGSKRIREVGMLKWIYYVRPENPSNHGPEESQKAASIIKAIKNGLVRGQQHHENVQWCSIYRSELSIGSHYRPGFTDSSGGGSRTMETRQYCQQLKDK